MPYEDDYKMWLEKSLIEMNPDWVCDGMADKEFMHKWCEENCGKDNAYIMPKCLHMYYHHIARADRKTENSSEIPNNCETCKHNKLEWYSEICDSCCGNNNHYEPKDEPQTERE